jgi:terminase, large subunit
LTDEKAIEIPRGVLVLCVSVDVHKNRLELLWDGWGKREESWLIDHVVLPGEVEDDAIWTQLGTELSRQFDHSLGCKTGLRFALVDGGKWPDWVYKFLRRLAGTAAFAGDPLPGSKIRGKIRACRGYGGPTPKGGVHPIVSFQYSKSLAKNLGGHWVGTDAAKDLIYTRARLEIPKSGEVPDGFMHFSNRFDEEFLKQMFAEKVTVKFEGGKEIRTYANRAGVRNEALDLKVYNLAAFRLLRLNDARLGLVEADLRKAAEEAKGSRRSKPKATGELIPAPGVRGRGWNL